MAERELEVVHIHGPVDAQVLHVPQVVDVHQQEGVCRRVVAGAGEVRAVRIDRHGLEYAELAELVEVVNRQAESVELRGARQLDARVAGGRDGPQLEDEIVHVIRAVHREPGQRRVPAQHINRRAGLAVGEVQLINHRVARRDGEPQGRVGRGQQRVKPDAVVHPSRAQSALQANLRDGGVEIRHQVVERLVRGAILTVRGAGQHAELHGRAAVDAHAELDIGGDLAIGRRIRRAGHDGLARDVAILELQGRQSADGVVGVGGDLDGGDATAQRRDEGQLSAHNRRHELRIEVRALQHRVEVADQVRERRVVAHAVGAVIRQAQHEGVTRPIEQQVELRRLPGSEPKLEVGNRCPADQGHRAKRGRRRRDVVAMRALALVGQDGVAGGEQHRVVARPGVHPNRLLHGGPDVDLIVAVERINDDRDEVALRRQQAGLHLLLLILGRRRAELVAARGPRRGLIAQGAEVGVIILRVPDGLARTVGGVEVQLHRCGEGEVAVVVREPRDEVQILEEARLGHEVHVNYVVRVGRAVIPDLVALLGVVLPVITGQAAVERLKERAVGAIHGVRAPVAIHEVQPIAAVEIVVALAAEHPVEAGVLQHIAAVPIVIEVLTRLRIGEDAELRDELEAGGQRAEHEPAGGILSGHLALEERLCDLVIDLADKLVERRVCAVGRERDCGGGVVVSERERGAARADPTVSRRGTAAGQDPGDGNHALREAPFRLGRVAGRNARDAQGRPQRGEGDAIQQLAAVAESAGRLHHARQAGLGERGVDVRNEIAHRLVRIVRDVGRAVRRANAHHDIHRFSGADDQREVRVGGELPIRGHVRGGDDPCHAIGVGDGGPQLVRELQLGDGRVVDAADVRINRPCVEPVGALTRNHVVVALAAEEPVVIRREALPRAAIAEEPVVAAEAIHRVATKATIQAVATRRAKYRVVAGPAVHHPSPVGAPVVERRHVHGIPAGHEAHRVIATETGDAELLNHRHPNRVTPSAQAHLPLAARGDDAAAGPLLEGDVRQATDIEINDQLLDSGLGARGLSEAQTAHRIVVRAADAKLCGPAEAARDNDHPRPAPHRLDLGVTSARIRIGEERTRVRRERLVERIHD